MATPLPSRTLLAAVGKIAVIAITSLLIGLFGIAGLYGSDAIAASSLPGGASSLQETYEDWQVNCTSGENGPSCLLMQQQIHTETRQPLLAVEIVTTDAGRLSGAIALPLGLRLRDGVTVQVDEGQPSPPMPFSTCVPRGCLVPFTPDEVLTSELREGETLRLVARLLDGRAIHFSVSLKGFSAALDRLQALQANM